MGAGGKGSWDNYHPLPPTPTFLDLAVDFVLFPALSDQVDLWTPFTVRTQASLRHEEEWAGLGEVMEKQKH